MWSAIAAAGSNRGVSASNELLATRGPLGRRERSESGGGLQVRAEGQQTAIAILHHKLTRAPRHVAKSSRELHALGGILGIERVCILDIKVRVEQFVRVFVRIGRRRRCAA